MSGEAAKEVAIAVIQFLFELYLINRSNICKGLDGHAEHAYAFLQQNGNDLNSQYLL